MSRQYGRPNERRRRRRPSKAVVGAMQEACPEAVMGGQDQKKRGHDKGRQHKRGHEKRRQGASELVPLNGAATLRGSTN